MFCIILSCIIISISNIVSTKNSYVEKTSTYECGFDPYEDARNTFDVRFYLIAILFIVFDLETIYFFPCCVSLSFLNIEGFFGILDFIFELIIGYLYAWNSGALDWE